MIVLLATCSSSRLRIFGHMDEQGSRDLGQQQQRRVGTNNPRSMKHIVFLLAVATLLLPGCFSVTRTERDVYTITQRDTTIRENVNNGPGQRDNGTIYPSPSSVDIHRRYVQRDSVLMRYYPAFLRLGGIEAAGLLTTGASTNGGGNGLFGVYDAVTAKHPSDTKVFGANMYRLFPYETRLRWFNDAPNWTIGTAAVETFLRQKDSSVALSPGEYLVGMVPLYIRKRYFLREEIPYIMVIPFFGLGLVPSQYINLGATIDVGSYGGFNVRGYAGFVAGSSLLLRDNPNDRRDYSTAFPYFGIGISALDFVNKTEELFVEWKDHKHSALEVSALNVDLVRSLSSKARIVDSDSLSTGGIVFSGVIARFASATYPLPFGERRWYVGTSLFNLMALSATEIDYAVLPIRTGYRFDILYDELNLEPFVEFSYYPSRIFHAGARLALRVNDWAQVNVVAGFANGSGNQDVPNGLEALRSAGSWSAGYVGVGLGIGDVFHTPAEVMRK